MGECAVIRHQHKARAGLVQPPGGKQAAAGVGPAHKVHHSHVVFVRRRTHHTLGFVQHDVHILLQDERLPVQHDSRAGRHLSVNGIDKALKYLEDDEMVELSLCVLVKLKELTDHEFMKMEFVAAE